MQPFLNLQFVEFERERRYADRTTKDPDGFLLDEAAPRPDPIGFLFVRVADRVENLVRSVLDRRVESADQHVNVTDPGEHDVIVQETANR